jgi:hypothetical protein
MPPVRPPSVQVRVRWHRHNLPFPFARCHRIWNSPPPASFDLALWPRENRWVETSTCDVLRNSLSGLQASACGYWAHFRPSAEIHPLARCRRICLAARRLGLGAVATGDALRRWPLPLMSLPPTLSCSKPCRGLVATGPMSACLPRSTTWSKCLRICHPPLTSGSVATGKALWWRVCLRCNSLCCLARFGMALSGDAQIFMAAVSCSLWRGVAAYGERSVVPALAWLHDRARK